MLMYAVVIPLVWCTWQVFKTVANRYGSSSVRQRNRVLETPIVSYRHQTSGRHVIMIGTVHVGDAQYYRILQSVIDRLTNFAILFEAVHPITEEELIALNEQERLAYQWAQEAFKFMRDAAELLSAQHQRTGLRYEPTWIQTDTTLREIVKKLATIKFVARARTFRSDDLFHNEETRPLVQWLLNFILGNLPALSALTSPHRLLSRSRREFHRIIVTERDLIAATSITQHVEQGDVVSIWGAGHLPGIGRHLRARGFVEIDRIWVPAYTMRDIGLGDALDGLSTAIKTKAAVKK